MYILVINIFDNPITESRNDKENMGAMNSS